MAKIARRRKLSPFQRKLRAAIAETALERFAPDDPNAPDVIYHYTDPKGLIGILSDGRLWATDIRYLNDSSELQYAQEVHNRMLQEMASTSATFIEKALAERAMSLRYTFASAVRNYVTCFSAHDDLLSQWKTYSSWGAGFSIGFDRVQLARMLNPSATLGDIMKAMLRPDTRLVEVKYLDAAEVPRLKKAFERFASTLDEKCSEDQIQKCAQAIVDNVALAAAQFKHPGFRSEGEWRLVIATIFASIYPLDLDDRLLFRASSRTVIPYLTTEKQADGKLPIVSVTIGPTLHQELSELSVRALLKAKGYSEVKIKASSLPLTNTD